MGRVVTLGPGACSDIETGARYFSAMAFPLPAEDCQRRNAELAWAGAYVHAANKIDHCTDPFEDTRLNRYAELPAAWCKAQVRTTRRRLRDRSRYAQAMRPLMKESLGLPMGPDADLTNKRQRDVSERLHAHNHLNFEQRTLRPSRPVAHMAIAQDLVLTQLQNGRTEFNQDLAATKLLKFLGELGSKVACVITHERRFKVQPEDLIEFDWVD